MTRKQIERDLVGHLDDLQRFARWLVGPSGEAEAQDLLQDCVERALRRADQFEAGTNLRAWLMTMMRNIHISGKRREQVRRRHAEQVARGPVPVQAAVQLDSVMLDETARAIDGLPADEADAIRTAAIDEQPLAMIAKRHRVPVGTIKSRLSRTRSKLRASLGVGTSTSSQATAA